MDAPLSRWFTVQAAPGLATTAARRRRQAPDPAALSLDPRGDADQLRFVQELAGQLHWPSAAEAEPSPGAAAAIDWRAFCSREDLSPEAIAAFVRAAEAGTHLTGEQRDWIGRPHFALLLVFIHLLRHQRQLLNELPSRHLRHYLRDRLGFQPRPSEPDRVMVAFRLAEGAPPLLLKAGSRLRAGSDSQGRERRYRTLDDLSVNEVMVTRLRCIQLHQGITDLEVIQANEPDAESRLNHMLALVYVDRFTSGDPPTVPRLQGLLATLLFCSDSLKLDYQDLQRMMALVRQRTNADSDLEWATINRWLGLEPLFQQGVLKDPRDFETNFNASLLGPKGGKLNFQADGLSEVKSIDDLYNNRDNVGVQGFLRTLFTAKLCSLQRAPGDSGDAFQSHLSTFERVMQQKQAIDAQWQEVNGLLERLGQRQRQLPSWRLDPDNPNSSSPAFAANLALALGGEQAAQALPWPNASPAPASDTDSNKAAGTGSAAAWPGVANRCEAYANDLEALRERWALPLERLQRLSQRADQVLRANGGAEAWQEIRELLGAAHQERWLAGRRSALARARQGHTGAEALLRTLRQALLPSVPKVDSAATVAAPFEPPTVKPQPETLSFQECVNQLRPWLPGGAQSLLDDFNTQLLEPGTGQRRRGWSEVDALLERAQRARDGVEAPPLTRLDWRLVEANEQTIDATAMVAGEVLQPCFRPAAPESAEPPGPGPGFTIASRLLGLAEGRRQISLRLRFTQASGSAEALLAALTPPAGQALKPEACAGAVPQPPAEPGWGLNQALLVELTTAAGWWPLPILTAALEANAADAPEQWALKLQFSLAADAPSLEPLPGTTLPRLRLRLRPFAGGVDVPWRHCVGFDGLRLSGARLDVAVQGLKDLRLQQEGNAVAPREAFAPFGSSPMLGSSLLLSHPELLDGDLTLLRFQGRWQKLPADLDKHYAAYRGWPGLPADQAVQAGNFRMDVSLVSRQRGELQGPIARPLFTASGETGTSDRLDATCAFAAPPSSGAGPGASEGVAGAGGDLREQERVWRWRLTPTDLGHGLYPSLLARRAQDLAVALSAAAGQQSLALAAAVASSSAKGVSALRDSYQAALRDANAAVDPATYSVPAPYTPLLEGLEVSYSRSQELGSCDAAAGQVRRVHLFEEEEPLTLPPPPQPGHQASPVAAPLLIPSQPDPGELWLELQGVRPGQPLTLALRLAEGSARGPRPEPAVLWEARQGWGWQPLRLRQDGSDGLLHSGIVRVSLPDALAAEQQTPRRLWIRARLRGEVASYASLLALLPQAVEAEAVAADGDLESAAEPLPPHSITGLEDLLPGIAAVHQPFSSRPGRAAETELELAIRAAEQLRHKGRALAGWDYERLLWERFGSQLHAVTCLPSVEAQRLELVVIPNLLQQVPRDPFNPGAPTDLLDAMRRDLRERCPPELELVVRNARYVHVKARLWVCLKEGVDPAWAEQELRQQLIRGLSPWCFDAAAEARLGGEVRASDLVAVIEPLPYVAYLERLMLFLVDADGKRLRPDDQETSSDERLRAPGADVVLIAAASQAVEFVAPGVAPLPSRIGIGAMRIGLDLQVT